MLLTATVTIIIIIDPPSPAKKPISQKLGSFRSSAVSGAGRRRESSGQAGALATVGRARSRGSAIDRQQPPGCGHERWEGAEAGGGFVSRGGAWRGVTWQSNV